MLRFKKFLNAFIRLLRKIASMSIINYILQLTIFISLTITISTMGYLRIRTLVIQSLGKRKGHFGI